MARIGTSGWVYDDWRGRLYPDGLPRRRWLAHYAGRFDCVEVNGTFYRLPREDTLRAWADQVPPDFRFAVKGSRYVTHYKHLVDVRDSVALVTGRIRALGQRLGPVLWQLDARHRFDAERLDAFLAVLPRDLTHVLEARHPSWRDDRVRGALSEAGVGFVCWDLRGERWVEEPTANQVYVRFHGVGSYDEELLTPWIADLRRWQADGREIWAFFNNDVGGHAVVDAERLRTLL